MPLYTRRGDHGETDIIGGRLPKDHPRVSACGDIDELNAVLALLLTVSQGREVHRLVGQIQRELFTIGCQIATVPGRRPAVRLTRASVSRLEKTIDRWLKEAPLPDRFVIPGGTTAAVVAHMARTVCRRAERSVVALSRQEPIDPLIIRYLNRLSDLLFSLALLMNVRSGVPENVWEGTRDRKKAM